MRISATVWGTLAVGCLVLLPGCGEQDLYKPPHSPYQVTGRVPLPSSPEDVAVLGNTAYVAGGEAGLYVIDISDPSAPVMKVMIDTKKYAEAINVASVPYDTEIYDIAFVVEGTEGITTYNVSDPDSVYFYEGSGSTAVDGNGLFIDVPDDPSETYVVYLAENWKGLRIFEPNLENPGVLDYNGVFSSTRGYAKAVAVSDGWAYVADDELGLTVLDVRTLYLGNVQVVSATDTDGNARDVVVDEGHAYIADGENGLVIMAIDEDETPVIVGHLPLPGDCRAIEFRDEMVFLAAEDGGLQIVGVSDPANPVLVGQVITSYANGIGLSKDGIVVVSDRDEGVIVLAGPTAFQDTTPPSQVSDLSASASGTLTANLTWHAPGNDQYSGTAASYDIRYATSPITDESWEDATRLDGVPSPSRSGSVEEHCEVGLSPGTTYYFALRAVDEASNWSVLSNVASASTSEENAPPALSNGSVSPLVGEPGDLYTFEVTYADGDDDPPAQADLILGGESYEMSLVSGSYPCGAVFRRELALDFGIYEYSYEFDDGNDHIATTPAALGPFSGPDLLMGSPADEPGRDPDETEHFVIFTREIEVEDHEVTQDEYEDLMGANPSRFLGADLPVENVSWFDAVAYCNARSVQAGLTPVYTVEGETVTWDQEADGYRLPTEAEWEWACRAGTQTAFATGAITELACGVDPVLTSIGWYCGNADFRSHAVRSKDPNAWGLYDMHGNVWEWCWDFYGELGSGAETDPTGPETGIRRVIRGGSWDDDARECRSASRAPYYPNSKDDIIGFRVVRTVD